ncbi:pyridoxal phosphate-dependent decarboxylase family protein [Zophobihabitans entericus]|uniref:Aspartate aminotransferase family protein n=1 Tax=Zophobihabitans entericus TaxID=1635327 RepID=A0A6G9ICR9_9GAMM|nr:aminotransferase class V-fold PLP-dependent enzyme [Zophobihabitans entericus]QIQ21637.1 aspartate aminotransferase family protein [Zophobihabitans entericus]
MTKQNEQYAVLNNTLKYAMDYLNKLEYDDVCATKSLESLRQDLNKPLNTYGESADTVISELVKDVDGGLLGSAGGRFFAWVIGGCIPAALAADWLTSTWDQNAALYACSPAEAVIEEVVGEWLKTILGLPQLSSFAITTGCQMAHFTCLATARNALLKKHSWDVEVKGLSGAPQIYILTNKLLHASVERAARFLGLGSESIKPLEINESGQLKLDSLQIALEEFKGKPVIVQLCAGDINTGVYDNFNEIIPLAHAYNAWVHVDGAFGLWANASNKYCHMLNGVEYADSWATDGHKWLNIPYDCGYAFVKNNEAHKASMSLRASYLTHADTARDQFDWNPEWSRRGRGVPTYAAIRQLGTNGIADLIERCCQYAHRLTIGIGKLKGAEIIWEPTINQGLIRFVNPQIPYTEQENDAFTDLVINKINASGKLFVGGTTWNGRRCMRISVCGWQTTEADIEMSIKAVAEVLDNLLSNNKSHSLDSSKL